MASDIPLWGEVVVYTSPGEAKAALQDDEADE